MNLNKNTWGKADIPAFLEYLNTFSKGKNKGEWEQRIVNTHLNCIAVPSVEVDRIAREIFKGNYQSFLDLWIWENHTCTLIFGKILSKIKDYDVLIKYLLPYSEKADNWSTIDCLKFNFNKNNIDKFLNLTKELILSKHTFSRRLALIILLKALSFGDYTKECFLLLNTIKDEKEYYVNMAGAWLLCECMIKYREETLKYYKSNTTNNFVINKSISKCHDSYRISPADKEYLKCLKRI